MFGFYEHIAVEKRRGRVVDKIPHRQLMPKSGKTLHLSYEAFQGILKALQGHTQVKVLNGGAFASQSYASWQPEG